MFNRSNNNNLFINKSKICDTNLCSKRNYLAKATTDRNKLVEHKWLIYQNQDDVEYKNGANKN